VTADAIVFPDPWWDLRAPDETTAHVCEVITGELQREIARGHPLAGIDLRVMARCEACDDIVVALADGRLAVVHLTWSGKRRTAAMASDPGVHVSGPAEGAIDWHPDAQSRSDAVGALDWTVSVDATINRAHQHAAAGGRLRRPSSRRQPHDGNREPALPSAPGQRWPTR
jgi:hypothetical protein